MTQRRREVLRVSSGGTATTGLQESDLWRVRVVRGEAGLQLRRV